MDERQETGDIVRIVFREILEGDRRKFIAQSNISKTGGGARDLRFRSWNVMEPVLRKLFPQPMMAKRQRSGVSVMLEVYAGKFHWVSKSDSIVESREALLEPPTSARAKEARITRVHEYDCFSITAPEDGSGRLLVLFIQKLDGSVWPFVITERSLEHDDWNHLVSEFLLSALNANRRKNSAAYGFVDFTTGEKLVR